MTSRRTAGCFGFGISFIDFEVTHASRTALD